jgi:hypothetical protein
VRAKEILEKERDEGERVLNRKRERERLTLKESDEGERETYGVEREMKVEEEMNNKERAEREKRREDGERGM